MVKQNVEVDSPYSNGSRGLYLVYRTYQKPGVLGGRRLWVRSPSRFGEIKIGDIAIKIAVWV